jgi:hypothetical protein
MSIVIKVLIFFLFINIGAVAYERSNLDGEYGLNYIRFADLFFKKYKNNIKSLDEVIIVDFDVNFNGIEELNNFINRRIYINKYENPDSSIDDDKDGFINNTYGINLISNSIDPFSVFTEIYSDNRDDPFHEENKHGFHMLHIIDFIAISPKVKVYPINVNTIYGFKKAIDWVVSEKARGINIRVVNLPATTFLKLHKYNDKLLFNELKKYAKKLDNTGIILVTGAGNKPPVDSNPFAAMRLENILSVSVHDRNGNIIFKHNKAYVDFTVPIIFGYGTSEAASITSAIIATYYSIRGDIGYRRMLDFIKSSLKKQKRFNEFTKFGGFLQFDDKILSY